MIPSSLPIKQITILFAFSLILFLTLYPFNLNYRQNPKPDSMPPFNKLRRLPHVFSKVLELPFDSDADVSVQDRPDFIRFFADGVSFPGGVRTHVVEIHPGISKVMVRSRDLAVIDDLELNLWRFRLPADSRPEMATAGFSGGRLVVTVPKNGWRKNNSCVEDCGWEFRGNMGISILVEI